MKINHIAKTHIKRTDRQREREKEEAWPILKL
jgi:hypothetical protein